jgi:hypothetical protein
MTIVLPGTPSDDLRSGSSWRFLSMPGRTCCHMCGDGNPRLISMEPPLDSTISIEDEQAMTFEETYVRMGGRYGIRDAEGMVDETAARGQRRPAFVSCQQGTDDDIRGVFAATTHQRRLTEPADLRKSDGVDSEECLQ